MKAKKTEPAIEAVMIVDPSEYGLDKEQGKEMESQFLPVIAERNTLAEEYTRIVGLAVTPAVEKEAGDLRRKFVKVRTNTDGIHKVAKAYFLAGGRYVDAWKNKNNVIVEQMEEKLKEIETTSERARVEVAKKLEGERLAELAIYTEYPAQGLAFMPEEVYQNYLVGVKVSYEKRKEEAEKAEAERLRVIEEDRKERERIALENEQLRKEAEVKAAELEIERKKQAQILADQISKAKEELKKTEEEAKRKSEIAEEQLRLEQEATAKLHAEIQAKKDAELKVQQEADRKVTEAAKAPDKEKMIKWIDSLNIAVPELSNVNSKATANLISQKFEGFKNWAKTQIETL